MFKQEFLEQASLALLGNVMLDTMDETIAEQDFEAIEKAGAEVGREVMRRTGANETTIETLLDFHFKKWKDSIKANEKSPDAYCELRVLMAGFTEVYSTSCNSGN